MAKPIDSATVALRTGLRRRSQMLHLARRLRARIAAAGRDPGSEIQTLLHRLALRVERLRWDWADIEGEMARLEDLMAATRYVPDGDTLTAWHDRMGFAQAALQQALEAIPLGGGPKFTGLPENYPGLDARQLEDLKTDNLRAALAAAALGDTWVGSFPSILIIDPTNICNFRCRSCFQSLSQNFFHTHIPAEAIAALLPIMPVATELRLYGTGEPTLAPQLPLLAEASRRSACLTELLTNGSTLNRRDLPLASIDRLGISFDGATPRTFEAIRVGTDFHTLVQSITRFRQAAPATVMHFNMTVCRANLDELAAVVQLALKLGLKGVNLNNFHSFVPEMRYLRLRPGDRPVFVEQYRLARAMADEQGLSLISDINFDDLIEDHEPLDKEAILAQLEGSNPSPTKPYLAPLAAGDLRLASLELYPGRLGALLGAATPSDREYLADPRPMDPASIADTVRRLNIRLREPMIGELKVPYCLAPWVRLYAESTGDIRPCCVYDGHLGAIDGEEVASVWNNAAYRRLRAAMLGEMPLPHSCATCSSSERYHLLQEFLQVIEWSGRDVSSMPLPSRFSPPPDIRYGYWVEQLPQIALQDATPDWADIIDFQPRTIPVGAHFAVQPSGCSALNIAVERCPPELVVALDDQMLPTRRLGKTISATVPKELHPILFGAPRRMELALLWPAAGVRIPLGQVTVVAPTLSEAPTQLEELPNFTELGPKLLFKAGMNGKKGLCIQATIPDMPHDALLYVQGEARVTWHGDGTAVSEPLPPMPFPDKGLNILLWSPCRGFLASGHIPCAPTTLEPGRYRSGEIMEVEQVQPQVFHMVSEKSNTPLLILGQPPKGRLAIAIGSEVQVTEVGDVMVSTHPRNLSMGRWPVSLIDLDQNLIQSVGEVTVLSLDDCGVWCMGQLLEAPNWGPRALSSGEEFYVQSDGASVLWVASQTAEQGMVLGLGGELVPTTFHHGTLFARFSPEMHQRHFHKPAIHELWVYAPTVRRRQLIGSVSVGVPALTSSASEL